MKYRNMWMAGSKLVRCLIAVLIIDGIFLVSLMGYLMFSWVWDRRSPENAEILTEQIWKTETEIVPDSEPKQTKSFVGCKLSQVFDEWGNDYETDGYMGGFMVRFPQKQAAVILEDSGRAWDAPLTGDEIVAYELLWSEEPLHDILSVPMTYWELADMARERNATLEISERMEGYNSDGILRIACMQIGQLAYQYTWYNDQALWEPCGMIVIGKMHSAEQYAAKSYQSAYFEVLKDLVNTYGEAKQDTVGMLYGLIYAELIDFENDGIPELFCVANQISRPGTENRAMVFSWDGKAAKCVLNTTVGVHYGTTDVYCPVTIATVGTQHILVIGNSTDGCMKDECSVYTMKDAVLDIEMFYAENTQGENWPPVEENLDEFYINGQSVCAESYFKERNKARFAENSVTFDIFWQADTTSVVRTIEELMNH